MKKGRSAAIAILVVLLIVGNLVAFLVIIPNQNQINRIATECRSDKIQAACDYFDAQTEVNRAKEALNTARANLATAKSAYNEAQNQGGQ